MEFKTTIAPWIERLILAKAGLERMISAHLDTIDMQQAEIERLSRELKEARERIEQMKTAHSQYWKKQEEVFVARNNQPAATDAAPEDHPAKAGWIDVTAPDLKWSPSAPRHNSFLWQEAAKYWADLEAKIIAAYDRYMAEGGGGE